MVYSLYKNMNESHLLRLSLLFSIVGLILILFFSSGDVSPTEICSIKEEYEGKGVKVCGKVENMKELKGGYINFNINDGCPIKVFSSQGSGFFIENGDNVCVVGKVEIYNGALEVSAEGVEIA